MIQHPSTDVPFDIPGYLIRVGYLMRNQWKEPDDNTNWLSLNTDEGTCWQKPTPTIFTYMIIGATRMSVQIIGDDGRLRTVGISKDQYRAYAYTTLKAATHSFCVRKARQKLYVQRTLDRLNILVNTPEQVMYQELENDLRSRTGNIISDNAYSSITASFV